VSFPHPGRRVPAFSLEISMKAGKTIENLLAELRRQLASKRDLIVPSPLMSYATNEHHVSQVHLHMGSGLTEEYGITDLAQRQLADKLKIPYAYFARMRDEESELLDVNVNTWLQKSEEPRLVRTLDDRVRAVLSNRYRRLDNFDLAQTVLPILEKIPGCRIESAELTETKMYIKAVSEQVEYEVKPGDFVSSGVVVANSEVGAGSLSIQQLIYRKICSNGAIAPDAGLRKTHLGKLLQADEDGLVIFKEDTLTAEDAAFYLKVRDVVEHCVSAATLEVVGEKMRKATGIKITGNPVKSIEVLAQKHMLTEEERAGILRHFIEGADLSLFGVMNAFTGYSQEIVDYDRATDFEVLGGKLLELTSKEIKEVVEAA
jgi:hypothetical protein